MKGIFAELAIQAGPGFSPGILTRKLHFSFLAQKTLNTDLLILNEDNTETFIAEGIVIPAC